LISKPNKTAVKKSIKIKAVRRTLNLSNCTILGFTQLLTRNVCARNLPGCKARHARKAGDLTDIIETMWEPRRLVDLWVSTARYGDNFGSFIVIATAEVACADSEMRGGRELRIRKRLQAE
jgi:hypothetical protein